MPRVARDSAAWRVGFRLAPEFRCRGLAENHEAGFAQSRADWCVDIPRLILGNREAAAQCWQSAREDQILYRDGHPVECTLLPCALPPRLARPGRGHRAFVIHTHEGVELGVELLDSTEHGLHNLDRRHLARRI